MNLGSSFIYLVTAAPMLLLTLIIKILPECNASPTIRRLREYYLNKFYLSYFIRLIVEEYLIIAVTVGINLS
jgi:hypothetical protein